MLPTRRPIAFPVFSTDWFNQQIVPAIDSKQLFDNQQLKRWSLLTIAAFEVYTAKVVTFKHDILQAVGENELLKKKTDIQSYSIILS